MSRIIATVHQREPGIQKLIDNSSIYPAIVLLVTVGIFILLFTFFIPKFAKIFTDLGRSMPLLTRIMLNFGNFMKAVWPVWFLFCGGFLRLEGEPQGGQSQARQGRFSA